MSDVRIYQSNDGGNIDVVAGQLIMDDGLEISVYLSLFGGNEDDSGIEADDPKMWWGNVGESDLARHYRSETQAIIVALPLIPANLLRITDAVKRDLQWLADSLADSIAVLVTIPALNTVRISVNVVVDDASYDYVFTQAARARLEQ